MDSEKITILLTKIFSELKELKEGQLQNRESIELIAEQTALLTDGFERLDIKVNNLEFKMNGLESKVDGLESKVGSLETELRSIKEIVVRIENEQENKINILFDGHLQNKEKIAEHAKILEAIDNI